jgi:hypothetical protein
VLQRYCQVNNRQLEHADTYGEPGYTDPPEGKCILFANWNAIPRALQDRLEAQGYKLEWEDEWYVDSSHSPAKAWRTSGDSMCWESRVWFTDSGILTPDSDPQEWIDEVKSNVGKWLPSWFDEAGLTKLGYVLSKTGHDPGNRTRNVPAELRAKGYEFVLKNARRYEYEVYTRREAKRGVLFDGASGIYIPQRFAREIDRAKCEIPGFDAEDWAILEAGPEGGIFSQDGFNEHYWVVWETVLQKCKLTLDDGTVVVLEQDGDVFYIEDIVEYCEYLDTYYTHAE